MAKPLTAAEMRSIEHAAIESGAVTGLELMERAGAGVVEAIFEKWPELGNGVHRAIVLCGPGNNGGDGFVVARLLKDAGWTVDVFLHGDPDKLPPDAKVNYDRWCGMAEVCELSQERLVDVVQALAAGPDASVPVVDALFGIGQRAPMDAIVAPVNAMIDAWSDGQAGRAAPLFVSVDIPTGYDADTGQALAQRPLPSDLAVTFHRPKPIHTMTPFLDTRLAVVDIGL